MVRPSRPLDGSVRSIQHGRMNPWLLVLAFGGVLSLLAAKKRQEEESRQRAEVERQAELARAEAQAQAQAQHDQVRALVMKVYDRIARAFRVRPPEIVFIYDPSNSVNAASDGQRILVNTFWFGGLLGDVCMNAACDRIVALAILAHEMTHHVHGDALVPLWFRNSHAQELRADFYAGRVLALFGAEVDALERVLDAISRGVGPTHPTHPAFAARLRAAQAGHQYQLELGAMASA
jgi:hypothetical protein